MLSSVTPQVIKRAREPTTDGQITKTVLNTEWIIVCLVGLRHSGDDHDNAMILETGRPVDVTDVMEEVMVS